ncbi:FecR domain-containing protein [Chitinophaga sp.]|uniref:FecR family protein n=1 Tax=Chitinophaga sp. TaxID=1869181 RepID=UPI0031E2461F
MKQQRIYYLLERELDGTITADESMELEELKSREGYEPVERAIAALIEREAGTPMYIDPVVEDAGFEKIISVDVPKGDDNIVYLKTYRNWWRAAVAVILILCTGTYLLFRWSNKPGAEMADIQPGSSKAVLMLADGSVIPLDSAGNQVIHQGGVSVHQHGGQLQYALQGSGTEPGYNALTVPRGGQYQLILSDGTKVWLNAASTLKYPTAFTGKERIVELHGQGYFEVAGNAERPFKVKVNNMEIKVLGTRFDVMAYDDEGSVHTTLLEGAVSVVSGTREQLLKPGQQAILDHVTNVMSVAQSDKDRVTTWRTGYFEFDDIDLSTIMRQLSRWYDVDIIDKTEGASPQVYARISRRLGLAEVLHALEGYGPHFRIEGRTVIVLP